MTPEELKQEIDRFCLAVINEQKPAKLTRLVEELNRLLEQRDRESAQRAEGRDLRTHAAEGGIRSSIPLSSLLAASGARVDANENCDPLRTTPRVLWRVAVRSRDGAGKNRNWRNVSACCDGFTVVLRREPLRRGKGVFVVSLMRQMYLWTMRQFL
jgi:hypothetical protein